MLFVVQGGVEYCSEQGAFDTAAQLFSYGHNSPVYRQFLWDPRIWPRFMQFGNGPKEALKYGFGHERIGGPGRCSGSTAEPGRAPGAPDLARRRP